MNDGFSFFVVVLVIIGGFLALVGGCSDIYGRYQCANFATITGKETKWATLDICYIKTAEGWQRWDEYKARATAAEGLKAK